MFQMLGFFACIALGLVALAYGVLIWRMLLAFGSARKTGKLVATGLIFVGIGVIYFCYWASPYQVIVK